MSRMVDERLAFPVRHVMLSLLSTNVTSENCDTKGDVSVVALPTTISRVSLLSIVTASAERLAFPVRHVMLSLLSTNVTSENCDTKGDVSVVALPTTISRVSLLSIATASAERLAFDARHVMLSLLSTNVTSEYCDTKGDVSVVALPTTISRVSLLSIATASAERLAFPVRHVMLSLLSTNVMSENCDTRGDVSVVALPTTISRVSLLSTRMSTDSIAQVSVSTCSSSNVRSPLTDCIDSVPLEVT